MEFKEHLTNEEIKERFSSDFELVNYAIKIAESMIKSGRDPITDTDVKNYAFRILQMILDGQDEMIEIAIEEDDSEAQAAKEAIMRRVEEARAQMAAAEAKSAE